jgi:hypothetical protein
MAGPPAIDPAALDAAVLACLAALDAGDAADPAELRVAVRGTLRRLAAVAPGHSVEVRVPPYAAVQCIEGPRHTRGTPKAVVETDPVTWLLLSVGRLGFRAASTQGKVHASGERSDLTEVLPVWPA